MKRYYKNKKYISIVVLFLTVSVFLSGCAVPVPFMAEKQDAQEESVFTAETLGMEPDFSYEKKEESPNVKIDRLGYLPESTKTVFFQGGELPENFQVMEKDSGECVYEGKIRLKEEAGGISTGYGLFTELREEGNYYIQCDKIGCSYYFMIGKDAYLEKAKELGEIIEASRDIEEMQNTVEICEMISYLLAAYEMYPELFTQIWNSGNMVLQTSEETGEAFFRMLRRETDRLLSMQEEKTGGIYTDTGALSVTDADDREPAENISEEATVLFAATMAKYSYLYQQIDFDYANICLKAAAKAWRYKDSTKNGKNQGNDQSDAAAVMNGRFYAASELYRASNERSYHNYILQNQEYIVNQKEDFYLLMGKVTYLSTRRKVDHDLCGLIMDGLMEDAENIAAREKDGLFLVEEKEPDAMLWDMTIMAFANYAIMNHEYVTVIENHIHYLSGRNEDAAFLLENPGGKDAARMLLLLSVIEAEREIVEASGTEPE